MFFIQAEAILIYYSQSFIKPSINSPNGELIEVVEHKDGMMNLVGVWGGENDENDGFKLRRIKKSRAIEEPAHSLAIYKNISGKILHYALYEI